MLRTVPTFVMRIRSANLEILGFPMVGANYYSDIFARFKTIQRKQDLASDFRIQTENWGLPCIFLEIIKLQFGVTKR